MQLKVLLNRQLPGKVKDDPSSVERFFDVVLDIIVAAALVLFGWMMWTVSQLRMLKTEKWGYLHVSNSTNIHK